MEQRTDSDRLCPRCGWPESEIFSVVSRHRVTTGLLVYTRCVCGRLQMRSLSHEAAEQLLGH